MLRRETLNALHRVAHHPVLNLLAGLILLLTGMLEALATIVKGMFDLPLGVHHGAILFGFLQMIKALPDVMKGVRFVDDGEEGLFPTTTGGTSQQAGGG
ncbi:MAG: hypothetical protein DCC68_00465 [Planctomycetota bacterium]|nr:MAG: hypothetical protein DCC68_00465 [Planctomycetota bacterium]